MDVKELPGFVIEYPAIPPSSNNCYSTNRFGQRFLKKEGKAFKERVTHHVVSTYGHEIARLGKEPMLHVSFLYYLPKEDLVNSTYGQKGGAKNKYKGSDVSNRVKLFEDAVFEALGLNDSLRFGGETWKLCDSLSGGVTKSVAVIRQILPGTVGLE